MAHSQYELERIWAEVPPDYYFKLNLLQKWWHEWKWLVFQHLLATTKTPKTILEVGCAGGHLSAMLSGLYPKAKITGIDVYKDAVNEATERYPQLTFKVADAHKLPFKDNTFDLIVCSETIEHVVDPPKVLWEIRRVMKKDGAALIEMDSGSPLFRIIWWIWSNLGKGQVWKHAHLHPFTARELDTQIRDAGFIVTHKLFSHVGMAVTFLLSK